MHARLFLRTFATAFLGILLALQALLSLLAALSLLVTYPYLPAERVLAGLPDVLVHLLPLSVPFAVLLGGVVATRAAEAQQGFLWLELAGRDPRVAQGPVLVLAALVAAFLGWFQHRVLPAAEYQVRYGLDALADAPTTLALRLAHRPDALGGYLAGFDEADDTAMTRFTLLARRTVGGRRVAPAALAAERCVGRVSDDGRHLHLDLERGRYVEVDGAGARANVAFRRLSVRLDLRRLTARPKQEIIDLRCYTEEELRRLPDQHRFLLRHGVSPSDDATRRIGTLDAVRALRTQGALLPLLCAVLVVGILGRHGASRWPRVGLVVVTGLALLFEESLLGVAAYKREVALPGVATSLPTVHAGLTVALAEVVGRLRRRRRRGP